MPTVFTDVEIFQAYFDVESLHKNKDLSTERIMAIEAKEAYVSKIQHILRPFLLRRTKADVNLGLPMKKEILVYAPLLPQQREIYTAILDGKIRDWILKAADSGAIGADMVLEGEPTSAADGELDFSDDSDDEGLSKYTKSARARQSEKTEEESRRNVGALLGMFSLFFGCITEDLPLSRISQKGPQVKETAI